MVSTVDALLYFHDAAIKGACDDSIEMNHTLIRINEIDRKVKHKIYLQVCHD